MSTPMNTFNLLRRSSMSMISRALIQQSHNHNVQLRSAPLRNYNMKSTSKILHNRIFMRTTSTSSASNTPATPPSQKPHEQSATTMATSSTPSSNVEKDILPIDGLPRYPTMSTLGTLRLFDYIGTASFAYSGCLLAAGSGMDVLGATLVGTVTAIGGGTIRDAIILNKQPFWTSEPEYLYLSLLTAGVTFFAIQNNNKKQQSEEESSLEFGIDALGVGAFCVIGAQNGIRAGMPTIISILCGMATATFGGAVRDILCRRKVRILHSSAEIYASTAAAGAASYILVRQLRAPVFTRVFTGVCVAFALRAWAWSNGIRLPVWNVAEETTAQS